MKHSNPMIIIVSVLVGIAFCLPVAIVFGQNNIAGCEMAIAIGLEEWHSCTFQLKMWQDFVILLVFGTTTYMAFNILNSR